MIRRVAGVLWHPRATMAEVARQPAYISTWIALLAVVGLCGALLLSTPTGRQALVDERVRIVEAMGGRVDDGLYASWQQNPPWFVYATSGGRLLVTPVATVLVSIGLMALARYDGASVPLGTAMAVTVHATVILALQQVIATPLHFVRESLTSPTSLAGLMPMLEEGTWLARLFGSIDVFAVWWLLVLAVGLGAATGKSGRHYAWRLAAIYVGIAAVVASVFAVTGG